MSFEARPAVWLPAARPPDVRPAGLDDDDRLLPADAARQLGEATRIAERLEVEQEDGGPRVALAPLQEIVARHVGLVAEADERRDADTPRAGKLQERQADAAAL